jgi:muramoyltetrapeptide carboxypeptidase LdcA involved in peptidoglycan recycling
MNVDLGDRPTLIPRRVREGDTVAIVSPSFGAVGRFPHRTDRGIAYLESLGLRVLMMEHAAETHGWVSSSASSRAQDVNEAFSNDEVSVIVCGIGGNHSNQLLPLLDYELIGRNPKIFQGYSDITVLHWAFAKYARLRTFYGPALITQLAEYPRVHSFTDRFMRAAWFGESPLEFEAAPEWTDEHLEWADKTDLTRPREMQPGSGWVCVRPGAAEGWLIGGCIESLCWHVKGSESWLNLDGAVLFLETSEDAPSPAHVDAYLTDLENLGVFEQIRALVVGRPMSYGVEQTEELWQVTAERTAKSGIPVLGNVDCSHTDPMLTLPMGCSVAVDAGERRFRALEAATNGFGRGPGI